MNKSNQEIRKILQDNKRIILNGRHQYIRPDDTKIKMMGTTTVSGLLPKVWMPAWGAKEAVKALGFYDEVEGELLEEEKKILVEKLTEIKEMTPQVFYKTLKEAKGAHARKSKDARDFGTEGHNWLERWSIAKINGEEAPKLIGEKWLDKALLSATNWIEDNVKEIISVESVVCDLDNNIGGKLDMLAELKTGEFAVIDFKFANHISNEYALQTAGYIHQLRYLGIDFPTWKRIILRLPKTEFLIEYDKKRRVNTKISNNFEAKEIKTSLEFDIQTFLNLRNVGRWINYSEQFFE